MFKPDQQFDILYCGLRYNVLAREIRSQGSFWFTKCQEFKQTVKEALLALEHQCRMELNQTGIIKYENHGIKLVLVKINIPKKEYCYE